MKINKFLFYFLLSLYILLIPNKCFASEQRNSDVLVRVGISNNNFSSYEHKSVSFSSNGSLHLIDQSKGKEVATIAPFKNVNISITNCKFAIKSDGKTLYSALKGPISIKSDNNSRINITGLYRKGKAAKYRGNFEVLKDMGCYNDFIVVNVLPLEEYLKGVVPNEMPVRFGLEAVKAQTVAARNYTLRPRTKQYHYFDVCDSVQSQVYFGANTEDKISNQAIGQTKGLFALYKGDVILALYSSTAGGYSENYENAFSTTGSGTFPSEPLPYLKGVPDHQGFIIKYQDLSKEANARAFYTTSPKSFDENSRYFRWKKSWTRTELESILTKTLKEQSKKGFVNPKYLSSSKLGTIKDINVIKRGVSGKAMFIDIYTNIGKITVSKELVIRRVFKKDKRILPSANVVFDLIRNANGDITEIIAKGGGLGHGVGLSQYGAGHLAANGVSFDKILQHYYSGIAIGTWPVFLTTNIDKQLIKQKFIAPYKKADLIIEGLEEVDNFEVEINGKKIILSGKKLKCSEIRLDISEYLIDSENLITYYPPQDDEEGNTIKAWVEVVRSIKDIELGNKK